MAKQKHYTYKDVAEFLEANGLKEAAEKLRGEFLFREKYGLCRGLFTILKENWMPLNKYLKMGSLMLLFAGTVTFSEFWHNDGFLAALKTTIDFTGFICLIGGVGLVIWGFLEGEE